MSAAFDDLIGQMASWPPILSYLLLGLSAFLENIVPPVPGDTVVVFGAYLVGRGVLSWAWVYAATCVGGTFGFMCMWYMGFTRGRGFLEDHRHRSRFFSADHLGRAQAWLDRHGFWLIAANRFLTGIRSAIALAAGMGRMPWQPVALLGALSMAIWNGLLLAAGLVVGRNWQLVLDGLAVYNRLALLVLAAVALVLVIGWFRRRRRGAEEGESVDSLSESP